MGQSKWGFQDWWSGRCLGCSAVHTRVSVWVRWYESLQGTWRLPLLHKLQKLFHPMVLVPFFCYLVLQPYIATMIIYLPTTMDKKLCNVLYISDFLLNALCIFLILFYAKIFNTLILRNWTHNTEIYWSNSYVIAMQLHCALFKFQTEHCA